MDGVAGAFASGSVMAVFREPALTSSIFAAIGHGRFGVVPSLKHHLVSFEGVPLGNPKASGFGLAAGHGCFVQLEYGVESGGLRWAVIEPAAKALAEFFRVTDFVDELEGGFGWLGTAGKTAACDRPFVNNVAVFVVECSPHCPARILSG